MSRIDGDRKNICGENIKRYRAMLCRIRTRRLIIERKRTGTN